MSKEYKIVLVGDGGVGKTTFINRHMTGHFEKIYMPTQGAQVHRLRFYTNYGLITFHVWDTAGQEKFGGLGDGYYTGSDAAIFMFDVTSRITYQNIPDRYISFIRVCGKKKAMLICGNKVDVVRGRKVRASRITFPKKKGIEYMDMSAKSNYNVGEAFLSIIRQLLGKDDVTFMKEPSVKPPEVIMSKKDITKMKADMKAMMESKIDDSSSDDDDL